MYSIALRPASVARTAACAARHAPLSFPRRLALFSLVLASRGFGSAAAAPPPSQTCAKAM